MSRSSDVNSYVPRLIARRFAANPTPITQAEGHPLRATVLFADISGFTALSERLAERGPIGAEHLVEVLNQYFGELINTVNAHGGDIVKFAGDALLALWYDDDFSLGVVKAAECALEVQEELQDYAEIADTPLSLKIGIAAGHVFAGQVGGVFDRWEFLVTGEPVVSAGLASGAIAPGSVVLSESAIMHARDRVRCEPLDEGRGKLLMVTRPTGVCPTPQPRINKEAEDCIRLYLPGAIKSRLEAGQSAWLAELRRVTVVFVNLPEWTTLPRLARVTKVVKAIQENFYRYRGSLNKLSVDEKGVSVLGAFGLPPVANEDDPERGVRAAMDIVTALKELDVDCRAGVATGRAFCGLVGNERRREYTMIGDVVNLAARLMISASENIGDSGLPLLCDKATRDSAAARFAFQNLGSVKAKGKSEQVAIFQPIGVSSEGLASESAGGDTVGRELELAALTEALAQLSEGQSGCLIIEGDAGIGKSQLASRLRRQAGEKRIGVLNGGGNAIEQSTAYHAWRGVFGQLFDVGIMANPEHKRLHLLSLLEDEEEWLEQAPLLNPVLAVNLPETELTRSLSGRNRADRTRAFLLELLKDSVSRSPKVVVLEDAHWLDSASWALAESVIRNVSPLLLVVCLRPGEVRIPEDMQPVVSSGNVTRLRLTGLSDQEIENMLLRRLKVQSLPDSVVKPICAQAEGNPHFAEALLIALRDSGALTVKDGVAVSSLTDGGELPAFPETLQGAVASQIDQLEPDHQLTLKVGSVIGRVIPSMLLSAVHPTAREATDLMPQLDRLVERELTQVETQTPERIDSFRHSIVQQATYDLMAYAQRREIHAKVAQWYEEQFGQGPDERGGPAALGSDLAPYFPLLAHHYFSAGDRHRARTYAHLAGRQASTEFSLHEALSLYDRALELTENDEHRVRFDIQRDREQVFELQGRRKEQRVVLRELFSLAEALEQPERMAQVHLRWGTYHDMTGSYEKAMRDAAKAESLARQCQRNDLIIQARVTRSRALSHSGQYNAAREGYSTTLSLARECEDLAAEAECLRGVAVVASITGQLEEARISGQRALQICNEINDRRGAAAALTMLGILARHECDFEQALKYFERAQATQSTIGYRLGENIALVNLASVLIELGQLERADLVVEEVMQLSDSINDIRGKSFGLSLRALLQIRRGNGVEAMEFASDALDQAESINDSEGYAMALTRMGHAALLCGRLKEAERCYREAEASRVGAGQESRAAEPRAGLVRCLLKTDRVNEALSLAQVLRRQFADDNLEGSFDAVRIGLACVEASEAAGRDIGPELVACLDTYHRVRDRITDSKLRRSFEENVPSHQELEELCRQAGLIEA